MEPLDYKKLYLLQDTILPIIFQTDTEFYLTGGTCLNRFYFEKRYSDDLDLFTNFSNTFFYSAREIIERISRENNAVEKQVDSKDFIRIRITGEGAFLQVDFVNDRVKRFGDFKSYKGYRLDNPLNILSNKITAVMGRDNPKDIFDICLLNQNMIIQWDPILAQAKEKLHFQTEDLLYRLKTFPPSLLRKLNIIDEKFLTVFPNQLNGIINDITTSI